MKSLLSALWIALGITTLCLLWIVAPLVSFEHNALYHWSGFASALFLFPFLDFCIVWVLITILLLLAQKRGRLQVAILSGITLFLPWIALKNWILISQKLLSHRLSHTVFGLTLAAFLLFLASWRPAFQPAFEEFKVFITAVFFFAAVSGAIMLCQLAWFGWQARYINTAVPPHHPTTLTATQPPRPRIIWILLDELSYQQVFEQRFPGLQLPAFDQLAAESTVFTHVIPAGIKTEEVMPSLMTGLPVDEIRSSSDGQRLSLHNPESHTWQPFDQHNTIFQDARNAGYSTAVAGWYNPYCRILPDVLDHCFWINNSLGPRGLLPYQSLAEHLIGPFQRVSNLGYSLLYSLVHKLSRDPAPDISTYSSHVLDYQSLSDASDRLIEDDSYNFIFLHMPVPHPTGIYNRATATFDTDGTSYIDNLALADKYLSHVRSLLQQKGQWDSSTIVIMGDHSWRTKLIWSSDASWTAEDQLASHGGQFDDRPGYIVKLPNQHQAALVNTPFKAIRTRTLFDALLAHQITSPDDLRRWAH
jgi:hypothetical protein